MVLSDNMLRLSRNVAYKPDIMSDAILTARQCRAARALLDWTQDELAQRSAVSVRAIQDFEAQARRTNATTRKILVRTFEDAEVTFTAQPEGCFLRVVPVALQQPAEKPAKSEKQIKNKKSVNKISADHAGNANDTPEMPVLPPAKAALADLRSLEEFHRALGHMDLTETVKAFADATENNLPHSAHMPFYAAVINRLWYFSYADASLSQPKRDQCVAVADQIMRTVHTRFADRPDIVKYFDSAMANLHRQHERARAAMGSAQGNTQTA